MHSPAPAAAVRRRFVPSLASVATHDEATITDLDTVRRSNKAKASSQDDGVKKERPPSLPALYCQWLTTNQDGPYALRRANFSGGNGELEPTLFRWTGCVWKGMNVHEQRQKAYAWLYQNQIHSADWAIANKCADTVFVHLPNFGGFVERTQLPCIATNRHYLVFNTERKEWQIEVPNASYGMTAKLDTVLDPERMDGQTYRPLSLEDRKDTLFARYMHDVMPDPAVRAVLQEAVASSFMLKSYECVFWLYGSGSNGKSTLLHLLQALHGDGYGSTTIEAMKGSFGLASLANKTCVGISEASPVGWDTDLIKMIASRDQLPVNRKFKDEAHIIPSFTLFIAMNTLPYIKDHTHGWKRKQILIPFSATIDKDRRVVELHKKITQSPLEMRCLLDWVLEGAVRLAERGRFLQGDELPLACREPLNEVHEMADPVLRFMHMQRVDLDKPTHWVDKKMVFDAFRAWADQEGVPLSRVPEHAQFWKRINGYAGDRNLTLAEQYVRISRQQGYSKSFTNHRIRVVAMNLAEADDDLVSKVSWKTFALGMPVDPTDQTPVDF